MRKFLQKSKSELIRLSLTLFVIAAVMAFLVALVNNITAPIIQKQNEEKISKSLCEIMPMATDFESIAFAEEKVTASDGKDVSVDGVWYAKAEGETVGVCVKVAPQGYGGKIETIVGIDIDGEVVSAKIISMSETSGIGTKIKNESFLSQFIGKKDSVSIRTEGINVITGATKSSSAYIRGIDAALNVASKCLGGDAK